MLAEMAPYILLGFLIAGLLHAFITPATFARHLSGRGFKSVVKAAAVGVPLPLCSCGVLPAAIAMRRGGASKAASTSFLIATPQTGVDSIAATASLLGPAFAVIRPVAALVTALFGGLAVGKTESGSEKAAADTCSVDAAVAVEEEEYSKSFGAKIVSALRYGFVDLVGSIGGWLVVGLIIAALITVYVPADAFAVLGDRPLLAMLAVLIVAVPMYVCATGSIPIALSLMLKGLSPGTALVLLMAGPAANFASFALISREMGRRAASVYLASIIVGALAFGLAIDYLMPAHWFDVSARMAHGSCHPATIGWFPLACATLLTMLLVVALIRNHRHTHTHTTEMTTVYNIQGMNCPHCQATVTRAISAVEGVKSVEVSLSGKNATVEGNPAPEAVIAAVRAAGFDASLPA